MSRRPSRLCGVTFEVTGPPTRVRLTEGLGSTVYHGLDAMTVRVDYEASVVAVAVLWPWPGAPVVCAPVLHCLRMEFMHSASVGCRERQVEAVTFGCGGLGCLLNAELVIFTFAAVSDGLIFFTGAKVFKDSHVPQRSECVVVESCRSNYVGYREGDVMEHVHE